MCIIADQLRAAWYKTTIQLTGVPTEAQKAQIEKDRQKPEYRAAIEALVDHLAICPECEHLRRPFVPAKDEPWKKYLDEYHAKLDEKRDFTDI